MSDETSLADLITMRDTCITAINQTMTDGQQAGADGRFLLRAQLKDLHQQRKDLDEEIRGRERGGIRRRQLTPGWDR